MKKHRAAAKAAKEAKGEKQKADTDVKKVKESKTFSQFREESKRDYKDEYKKFQSSPERIKYRSELVKFNRDKGTYGNGDGKDASHKGGKIVGFEKEGKNRGRAEASRLKGSVREGGLLSRLKRGNSRKAKIRTVSAVVGVRG